MPLYEFLSPIYIIRYHTSSESNIMSADFVPNITSLNVILYNSSVNKKLILLYFKHNVFLLNFAENILALKP